MATDKRVLKTRESILKAFCTLSKTKELNKITISQVAAEAGINRSTFYKHFKDINEIINDLDGKIKEKIASIVADYGIININRSLIKAFNDIAEALYSSEIMSGYIIHSSDSVRIIEKIKKFYYDIVVEDIAKRFPLLAPEKYIFAVTYVVSGCVDSLMQWIKRGDNAEPYDKFIVPIAKFNDYIFREVTNSD